ncbi:MAG TPA: RraA family protein [Candidatus Bathyarchaeia archaeon]|nr:RraA family protein [Candidatus Bathyarchaeia archaeon]
MIRPLITCVIAAVCLLPPAALSQQPDSEQLRQGRRFITTKSYTAEEDAALLALFEGLRVTDVVDAMDKVGLTNVGIMDPEIHPVWRDTEHFAHRFIGIALTVRYVPTNKPHAPAMDTEPFNDWVYKWYGELSPEPFAPLIRPGTALIIDEAPDADVGSIGSNNIMVWHARGCVGVVTDATARDTDEIAAEKMPLYLRKPGRGIRPGRNEIESVNLPVVCGGVLVEPGDVIVADGDGVVVVPRAKAAEVAQYAKTILDGDKAGRRALYKRLGLPKDDSVK